MEDKVSHLSKSLDKIEQRNHELQSQVNDLQAQKESDVRTAQAALRDQEKQLQELFYTKLDKKVNKLTDEKIREIEELNYHHQ